eukprot:329-Chlamydomonas_euryale.AAC.2
MSGRSVCICFWHGAKRHHVQRLRPMGEGTPIGEPQLFRKVGSLVRLVLVGRAGILAAGHPAGAALRKKPRAA